MNQRDLPDRWKQKIKDYLKSKGSKFDSLSVYDFQSGKIVEIKFEDGSFANFKYPLIIEAPEYEEVGILTEHCGYFIFNRDAISFELKNIRSK